MKTGRAISALKLAGLDRAAVEVAESVGKVPGAVIRAGKGALGLAGEIGEGLGRGAGAHPGTGRTLGKMALVGGGLYAANRGKDKLDNWKYQHGFYTGG